MSYIAEIESRVAGIPCLIGVSHFDCVQGSYSYNAASDMDYYGYSESEWDVLDRRGRPAAWLQRKLTDDDRQRKLTDDDRQRIEQEIAEAMTEEAY